MTLITGMVCLKAWRRGLHCYIGELDGTAKRKSSAVINVKIGPYIHGFRNNKGYAAND